MSQIRDKQALSGRHLLRDLGSKDPEQRRYALQWVIETVGEDEVIEALEDVGAIERNSKRYVLPPFAAAAAERPVRLQDLGGRE